MSIHRIYQGRVTGMSWITSEPGPIRDWEDCLWFHHALFQQAVNYYLVALAALDSRKNSPVGKMRLQMETVWEDFTDRHGLRRDGLKKQLSEPLSQLAGKEVPTLAGAFNAVLNGNETSQEIHEATIDLLLLRCAGDSGVQQGGRNYWPRFCEQNNNPTWDFSPSSDESKAGLCRLQQLISDGTTDDLKLRAFAGEMSLSWAAVKIDPVKKRKNIDAKARLLEAVNHFNNAFEKPDTDKALNVSCKRYITREPEEWSKVKATIQGLNPIGLCVPVNRKADPNRTFAALLFQLVPSPWTLGLLALVLPKPPRNKQQHGTAKDVDPEQQLANLARSLGDDPIHLARGARGFVFPAFTALPGWSKDPGISAWSEFDIAAFKEALKTLNQASKKGAERDKERQRIEKVLAWMEGKSRDLKDTAYSGEQAQDPPGILEGDPRFILLKELLEQDLAIQNELTEDGPVSYTLRRRALRGYQELSEIWNKKAGKLPGNSKEAIREGLLGALRDYQAKHADQMGSAALYERLCEPRFWPLWLDPDPETLRVRQDHDWSDSILEDYCFYLEQREDAERKTLPIHFTPADPIHSRRQFDFSGLTGKYKAKLVAGASMVDVWVAAKEPECITIRQARLRYSAPRLIRDGLRNPEGKSSGIQIQPMLATLGIEEEQTPLAKDPTVALMPEVDLDGKRRMLLNFPLEVDTEKLQGHLGMAQRWEKAFNGTKDKHIHLHWPDTLDSKDHNTAWWHDARPFTILSIDLGQRMAGGMALIQVTPENPPEQKNVTWPIGEAGGRTWTAWLQAARHLRLPGEDVLVLKHGQMSHEQSGASGRIADVSETQQATVFIQNLGQDPEGFNLAARSFPEQNDALLVSLRRAQGRLRSVLRWAWLLTEPDRAGKALGEISEQQKDPAWKDLADQKKLPPLLEILRLEAERLRQMLPHQLEELANRVLPMKGRRWQWKANPEAEGFWILRTQESSNAEHQKIRGQRGLSFARLEQTEELRVRCQSLNRMLERPVGSAPPRPKETRERPVPDPCPEILRKMENLREQRVNQTAHLILAQALGVRLCTHQKNASLREKGDAHGEYESIPGRKPVAFIVLEDLSRYLADQGRAPSENGRLMKWSHRAILNKVKQLAEPFGIPVLEVPAAYSSRFCSRTGVAGFRAKDITLQDLGKYPYHQRIQEAEALQQEGKALDAEQSNLIDVKAILAQSETGREGKPPRTLLIPKAGGPIFVPADAARNSNAQATPADINAAINLGLRAVASPSALLINNRIRIERKKGAYSIRRVSRMEKARFASDSAIEFEHSEDMKNAKAQMNVFVDVAHLATFEQARIPNLTSDLSLSSSKGLWTAVKQLQWDAAKELNQKRMAKWAKEIPF